MPHVFLFCLLMAEGGGLSMAISGTPRLHVFMKKNQVLPNNLEKTAMCLIIQITFRVVLAPIWWQK